MIFNRDFFDNITAPNFLLCKGCGDRIDTIPCTEKTGIFKFNAYNEITFTTYMLIDNEPNPVYDDVSEMKYIEIPNVGRYIITNAAIKSEGTELEYKECTALSEEILLGQKYLELFSINMGTTESIDEVQFYNQVSPDKSLLHLILEKCPDWSVGHIDHSLNTMQRCFQVDRQDVYSFLTQDVAEAFDCVFIFNTLNHTVNAYPTDIVGEDTDIFVTYSNLAKSTNISTNIDDIKTCLIVTGSDDLSLREVNMGYDRIYNIDYFHSLDYMSEGLYDAYTTWKAKWDSQVLSYQELVTQYQEYYDELHEITEERRPEDPDSTDWTLYGLNPLKEKLAAYEQQQAVLMKQGYGDEDSEFYESMYLPVYNAIQSITAQISVVQGEIDDITAKQASVGEQMNIIIDDVDMTNNFTSEQLIELTKFIREDELSSDNYVVTDTMTDSERMDMLEEMLKYGQKELAKVSQPTVQFDLDMANIYAIPEFNDVSEKFEPGNYIHVGIRDDYIIKTRLLTMTIDFNAPESFSATFSNAFRVKGTNIYAEISEALDMAQSVSTSVSFNASHWNEANKEATDIGKMIADGLLAAGQTIHTAQSDVQVDDRGLFINNTIDSEYSGDGIFLGGGQILFTDNGYKTIRTALGRLKYTKKGQEYNDFGLIADFVLAGYIAGSYIEGTEFDNGDGTFHVDPDGTLTASKGYIGGEDGWTITKGAIYTGQKSTVDNTSAGAYLGVDGINIGDATKYLKYKSGVVTVKGTIEADEGHIGGSKGWTIASGKIYSGSKSSFGSANSGTYLGTDGIDIGNSTKYLRYQNGALNIKGSITGSDITGGTIEGAHITGGEGMFEVDDDSVRVGGFEARYDWGRDIFQSDDGQCGMSASSGKRGGLWFWAGYHNSSNCDFLVNNNGQCQARDFLVVDNPDGYDDFELASTIYDIQSRIRRMESDISDLWDEIDSIGTGP